MRTLRPDGEDLLSLPDQHHGLAARTAEQRNIRLEAPLVDPGSQIRTGQVRWLTPHKLLLGA